MISIVIPVFNEQENIDILCEKLSKEAIDWGCPIEVIFVNDGSTDATRDRIIAQQQSGFPATIIQFSRNFGHQAAISAGIQHANGEAVVVMDGDLQDPPQTVSQFIKHWENEDGWKTAFMYGLWCTVQVQLPQVQDHNIIQRATCYYSGRCSREFQWIYLGYFQLVSI